MTWQLFPILLLISYNLKYSNGNIFNTLSGLVKGTEMVSRGGRTFSAFRGIPFAKPPVGELRFSNPVPADNWTGILNATEDTCSCPQKNYMFYRKPVYEGSEDCLYMNVYTPVRSQNDKRKYPVMVLIHFGGFFAGHSKSTLFGPKYLLDKDIVLVTFNYRLGVFGFYSTVDDNAAGNWGMKDQVLALKWVQAHISSFGGDPNSVTIFGESAGAGSTHHHILSPASRGLFHAAISQSGSALNIWAKPANDQQRNVSKIMANAVNCNGNADTKTIVECMRKVDARTLIEVQDNFRTFQSEPVNMFTLVTEKKTAKNPEPFLTEDPVEIIRKGQFARVPWINGIVQDEGILKSSGLLRQADTAKELNKRFDELVPDFIGLSASVAQDKIPQVWKAIKNYFFQGNNYVDPLNSESVQNFTDLFSDRMFTYGSYQSAILHSLKGHRPLWYYKFNYKGKYTFGDLFAATTETLPVKWGVSHCDDLIYLFDSPELPFGELSGDDLKMSTLLVETWTNFATHKVPFTGWDPIQEVDRHGNFSFDYLLFPRGSFQLEMSRDILKDRMNFWRSIPLNDNIPEIA